MNRKHIRSLTLQFSHFTMMAGFLTWGGIMLWLFYPPGGAGATMAIALGYILNVLGILAFLLSFSKRSEINGGLARGCYLIGLVGVLISSFSILMAIILKCIDSGVSLVALKLLLLMGLSVAMSVIGILAILKRR
ncbi:hypothetical protein [Vibrio mediterranei]|uniref:hypothetical protein n=1 Tax=Vibrio mediterranei TaxID=689 RepID=UPI001EFCF4D6|nr:hypothetical protein [Vibrio mediterranei]MCG9657625.1 hypothetical protein [Vibrio mediterranei]